MLRYVELHGRSGRGENHLETLTRCTRIPLEKAGCEGSSCDVITCFISVSFDVPRGVCYETIAISSRKGAMLYCQIPH